MSLTRVGLLQTFPLDYRSLKEVSHRLRGSRAQEEQLTKTRCLDLQAQHYRVLVVHLDFAEPLVDHTIVGGEYFCVTLEHATGKRNGPTVAPKNDSPKGSQKYLFYFLKNVQK